jgi:tetratricopeptide (TPR) repeat protein
MTIKLASFLSMHLLFVACSTLPPATPSANLSDFDQLWDYSDPLITELKFLEILSEVNFEQDPGYYLELKTQIARTLGLQQDFAAAHILLDEIETDLQSGFPIARIRYLLERGRVYHSSGNAAESKPFFLQAWELSQKIGADYYAIDAAHMLGIIERPDRQLVWNEKALALAETSSDPRTKGWLGSLYNNVGWAYHDLQNFEKALMIFEKAQRWRQMNRQVREIQIADWTVARTHRSLGNIELALEMQLNLEKEIAESGAIEDGYVFEEIGECLLLKNEQAAAAPYFLKAWTILNQDSWLQKNEVDRLNRLKELGQLTP